MSAETLAQALELIREHDAELTLMDLDLANGRGLDTRRRICAATSCPVMVVTTVDEAGVDETVRRDGAFEILHWACIDVDTIAGPLCLAEQ